MFTGAQEIAITLNAFDKPMNVRGKERKKEILQKISILLDRCNF